jgi:hypothetical protein
VTTTIKMSRPVAMNTLYYCHFQDGCPTHVFHVGHAGHVSLTGHVGHTGHGVHASHASQGRPLRNLFKIVWDNLYSVRPL